MEPPRHPRTRKSLEPNVKIQLYKPGTLFSHTSQHSQEDRGETCLNNNAISLPDAWIIFGGECTEKGVYAK